MTSEISINNYSVVYFFNSNSYLILDPKTYPYYRNFKINYTKEDYLKALSLNEPQDVGDAFFEVFTELSKISSLIDPYQSENLNVTTCKSLTVTYNNSLISVNYDSEQTLNKVFSKFKHLETQENKIGQVLNISQTSTGYQLENSLGKSWQWNHNNIHLFQGKFTFELLNCIYKKTADKWLGTFHASTIGNGQEAVMLVGNSGSGKSTLSALLMYAGYDLIADDITPIHGQNNHVYVLPAAISVKEKSFEIIKPYEKDFEKLPSQYVNEVKGFQKFICPKPFINPHQSHYPCQKIVLVRYSSNPIKTALKDGDIKVILEELISESWLSHDEYHAQSFLNWLSSISFYELHYHHNDEAISVFNNLLPI